MNTFYTSPSRTDRSTDSTSMLIKEVLHKLPNIFLTEYLSNGLPVSTPNRSTYRFTYSASSIGSNRSSPRLAQPMRPMLSLSLNTPPQAQLEALRDLLAQLEAPVPPGSTPRSRSSTCSTPRASTLPVSLSAHTALHSTPVVAVLAVLLLPSLPLGPWLIQHIRIKPNQTSEPTWLPLIGFRSRPSWLSPTRLRSSRP